MSAFDAKLFGVTIRYARRRLNLTQSAVAAATDINVTSLVRAETGKYIPRFDETIRIAKTLQLSLLELATGRSRPSEGLKGIAVELFQVGVCDLIVPEAEVPGAFRKAEEILVLALMGDRPEPRIVEAIPFVLAHRSFKKALLARYVQLHDRRVGPRLGWLSEITLSLARRASFVDISDAAKLELLAKRWVKAPEPDSLGHPSEGSSPPIWKRWNITYAGTMENFLSRTNEVAAAWSKLRSLNAGE